MVAGSSTTPHGQEARRGTHNSDANGSICYPLCALPIIVGNQFRLTLPLVVLADCARALYGFTMVYRYTHEPVHLGTAIKLADFFVARLSAAFPDHIPNFDITYDGLGPLTNLTHRDASAAAIAASGLLELADYQQDNARAKTYRDYAALAIEALSGAYASDFEDQEGAIMHCDAANCDVPWADYYLLEAIRRSRS